jgi:hypothetical protein
MKGSPLMKLVQNRYRARWPEPRKLNKNTVLQDIRIHFFCRLITRPDFLFIHFQFIWACRILFGITWRIWSRRVSTLFCFLNNTLHCVSALHSVDGSFESALLYLNTDGCKIGHNYVGRRGIDNSYSWCIGSWNEGGSIGWDIKNLNLVTWRYITKLADDSGRAV